MLVTPSTAADAMDDDSLATSTTGDPVSSSLTETANASASEEIACETKKPETLRKKFSRWSGSARWPFRSPQTAESKAKTPVRSTKLWKIGRRIWEPESPPATDIATREQSESFKTYLDKLDLCLIPVRGDGSCMVYASVDPVNRSLLMHGH